MTPALRQGQIVLVSKSRSFKAGDVVVAFVDQREVIKRATHYVDGQVFLEGDNPEASTDSRNYGWLVDRHVEGKVIWPRISRKILE